MFLFKRIHKSTFKTKIIITFSIVMLIFVIIVARVSYQFVRSLYLNQLSEQVNIITIMISKQVERKYLTALSVGQPTATTKKYFMNLFGQYVYPEYKKKIFIFDGTFNIVIHSDSTVLLGKHHPQLILNRKEIHDLNIDGTITSLPFKGQNDKWYLWGFYRLNDNYWLALQENAEHLKKVDEFAAIFWYIGFAGMILTFLLGWIIARAITKPIDTLVKFSSEIGKGNFDVSSPQGIKGEIKILSDSMDTMRRDLKKNQKEKEEILAQIAHEIRNPLGGIELLTNLIKEDIDPDSKNNEYLNKILKEISGLKALITAYLNYSRPLQAIPQWINLPGLINEVEKICEKQLGNKKIEFIKDIHNDKIWFDPGHLKQILINLINNSIESSTIGGMIKIQAIKNEKYYKVRVIDRGHGIQVKKFSTVFEPFYTTKKDGTGLGLAVSKKLCIENNASLDVENDKDRGCIFTIMKKKE